MVITELLAKLNQFENAVVAAWVYDTKLDMQEDYCSSSQMKKADEYHTRAREIKEQLIQQIKDLTNA